MAAPVLLVTGGSRGIGAATARLAGARGYDVAVNYARNAAAANEVVMAIQAQGRQAIAVGGDMASESDIERVFATVDEKLGRITHLVCNAGITGHPSRMDAVPTEILREVLDTNVMGVLLCLRSAVKRMSTHHRGIGGSIVLLSSSAVWLGGAGEYVWYAASKAAINAIALGLAREVAQEGIRVNAVAPGVIDTEIHAPGRIDRVKQNIPMQRAGTAEEVAETILFLLSDAASYVTGAVLQVSGAR